MNFLGTDVFAWNKSDRNNLSTGILLNPIPHGVFWITHTWGGQILPDPCSTAILKHMDMKFGML